MNNTFIIWISNKNIYINIYLCILIIFIYRKGLRNWIKDNNITSIYHVINKEEKDEEGNDIQEEYLIRNGNDYLNNLFSNIIKDIVLIPFPENPVVLKNSFVSFFNFIN